MDEPVNDVLASDGLRRRSFAEAGLDPSAFAALLDDAEREGIELQSIMLWSRGAVVAEGWWWPYRPGLPHMMHSATKSFLSTAIGFAVAEGLIRLDDRVANFFPDRIVADDDAYLARMTVEDLLTQTSGHGYGVSGGSWRAITTSWIDEFLRIPVEFAPGTKFTYSSATSFMLSAILTRVTGTTVHVYLTPRLLGPLGITDLRWDVGPEGINPGGNGISCRTADLLKLAVLYLQGGVWEGRQLLSHDWIRAATRSQRGNAHGYHWWIGPDDGFHAYGVFGQFAWARPDVQGALVVTAAVPNHEEALRALAARHLPALFADGDGADGRTAAAALSDRLAHLRLLPPFPAWCGAAIGGGAGGVVLADANEDGVAYFGLTIDGDRASFRMGDARGEHVVVAGLDEWIEGETTMSGASLHHGYEPKSLRVVAGGRWIDARTFEMVWQFVETAFRDTVTLHFDEATATLDRRVNVNTRATVSPTITGQIFDGEDDMNPMALMAIAAAMQASSTPPPTYTTRTTPIGELVDTPATRVVLERDAPFLLRHPRLAEARPYTLADIVQYAPELTPAILAKIDADLSAVPAPSPVEP